jgi:protein-tyrosine phosphatase
MPSVLFVCTANRFRSPIAAIHFARQVVKHGDDQEISVSSAGTWTVDGQPVTPDASILAEKYGFNLSLHKSRLLTKDILSRENLILVMENSHKEAILQEFPFAANRVFLLSEAANGNPYDIPDPYVDKESPEVIAKEIIEMIDRGYERIVQLAYNLNQQE